MTEKAKGKAREAAGALTGDEGAKREGRAEQDKHDAEKSARRARTEREASDEETRRDAEERRNRGGLLGGGGVL